MHEELVRGRADMLWVPVSRLFFSYFFLLLFFSFFLVFSVGLSGEILFLPLLWLGFAIGFTVVATERESVLLES